MPSMKDSLVPLDPQRWKPVNPVHPTGGPEPVQHGPVQPPHLIRSPVMISSLPGMATSTDGLTRQFYGGKNLPIRRLILPS
jgi:hypothetical protein